MSSKYQESTGLIIPSINHVGYERNPTPTEIKKDLNEKYKTSNTSQIYKFLTEESLSTPAFSRSGAIPNKNRIVKMTPLKKSLTFLTHGLRQNPGLIIPNLGCYLAGDLSNSSYLVSGNKTKQEIDSGSVNLDPKFEIYYIYFDGTKGCVLKIKNIEASIREELRVSRYNRARGRSDKISIKKKHFYLKTNAQNRVEAEVYSLESDRVVTKNQIFIADEINDKLISFPPLKNYSKREFNTLLRKIKTNYKSTNSEKIFPSVENFNYDTYNFAYFVPEKSFSESYINALFLLLIAESLASTKLDFKFINIYNYLIAEYFLNKIYYKIRNVDSAFDFRDILLNKKYDEFIARKDTSPRSWTNTQVANQSMKQYFLESNVINFRYSDYVPAEFILRRSGASSTSLQGINLPKYEAAGLYSFLTDNFAFPFLDAIYKHATFRLNLNDNQFNTSISENKIDISIQRKLIELTEL